MTPEKHYKYAVLVEARSYRRLYESGAFSDYITNQYETELARAKATVRLAKYVLDYQNGIIPAQCDPILDYL